MMSAVAAAIIRVKHFMLFLLFLGWWGPGRSYRLPLPGSFALFL